MTAVSRSSRGVTLLAPVIPRAPPVIARSLPAGASGPAWSCHIDAAAPCRLTAQTKKCESLCQVNRCRALASHSRHVSERAAGAVKTGVAR